MIEWIRSTACGGGECVEVFLEVDTALDGQALVAVRNSRVPGEIVWFDQDEWGAFLAGVKAGEFG
jgi:hypothetical protein